MKILLFTHYYEPELGAPQRRWSGFIRRWQKAGHEVTVYCPSPHYPDRHSTEGFRAPHNAPFRTERGKYGETIHRVPYFLHGYSGITRFIDQSFAAVSSLFLALVRERKTSYDAVISTVPGLPSAFAGQIFAGRRGVPHVLDLRDAWPDILMGEAQDTTGYSAFEKFKVQAKGKLSNSLIKAARYQQRQADLVVTTTYAFARILRNRGLKRVDTVTNGADPQEFIESIPHVGDINRPLRIQYLGTIGRSQGLIVALDALRELKKRNLDWYVELRIIGEGADLPNLKAYAQKHHLQVEFVPPVPRERLADVYAWADANLVSLRKAKAFEWTVPSKIFELISTKRRIIALVDGEAARLVQQTKAGVVLPPSDSVALADELEKFMQRPELGSVGDAPLHALEEEYSYDILAERYLELLEDTEQKSVVAKRSR